MTKGKGKDKAKGGKRFFNGFNGYHVGMPGMAGMAFGMPIMATYIPPPPSPQWFRCSTNNCKGKWCLGPHPSKTCRFCHKPCKYDNPILDESQEPRLKSRAADTSQGQGPRGKGRGKGKDKDNDDKHEQNSNDNESKAQAALDKIIKELISKGDKDKATQLCEDAGIEMPKEDRDKGTEVSSAKPFE